MTKATRWAYDNDMVQSLHIVLGSDHAGFALKEVIKGALQREGYGCHDVGTHDEDSCDYPVYAHRVADAVVSSSDTMGILVCGTGLGMSMAANRHKAVRAAVCHDDESARFARAHNDANILALGSRLLDAQTALSCVRCFLQTQFDGGRHRKRIHAIELNQ